MNFALLVIGPCFLLFATCCRNVLTYATLYANKRRSSITSVSRTQNSGLSSISLTPHLSGGNQSTIGGAYCHSKMLGDSRRRLGGPADLGKLNYMAALSCDPITKLRPNIFSSGRVLYLYIQHQICLRQDFRLEVGDVLLSRETLGSTTDNLR